MALTDNGKKFHFGSGVENIPTVLEVTTAGVTFDTAGMPGSYIAAEFFVDLFSDPEGTVQLDPLPAAGTITFSGYQDGNFRRERTVDNGQLTAAAVGVTSTPIPAASLGMEVSQVTFTGFTAPVYARAWVRRYS